jgi:hypothetical protein
MVMATCRAILGDHHLAEDAFQATFLALARKAASIGRREAVGTGENAAQVAKGVGSLGIHDSL